MVRVETKSKPGMMRKNPFVLDYLQSCTLILVVRGSLLLGALSRGSIVCEQANPSQCYQPSRTHSLRISITGNPVIDQVNCEGAHYISSLISSKQ